MPGDIPSGTRFTVRGVNFDLLPSSVIATWSADWETESDNKRIMDVIERGEDYIILETRVTTSPSANHYWQYFATPASAPRSLIEYVII